MFFIKYFIFWFFETLTAVKRVFSQKRMRQQTERKYKQLAEVQSKQQDTKRKEAYRTNRLMAEVFTKVRVRLVIRQDIIHKHCTNLFTHTYAQKYKMCLNVTFTKIISFII